MSSEETVYYPVGVGPDPKLTPKMIQYVAEDVPTPVLSSIDPTTAVIGDPPVTLTCTGSDFTEHSIITFGANDVVTVFVSDTEVTTHLDLTGWDAYEFPVVVRTAYKASDPQTFTFTESVTP